MMGRMEQTLSYVIVTPYTVAKSRTGGVISRLLSRTNLELVGAQMIIPDDAFARNYADSLRKRAPQNQLMLLADYAEVRFAPSEGRPHRTLLLLFRGENPCAQLLEACGHIYTQHVELDAFSGETIRDTYADLIFSKDDPDEVSYFEPAVFTPRHQDEADMDLELIAGFLDCNRGNIVRNITYPDSSVIERTIVIIKPDNWNYASSKPGSIIDMFSRTGLRIVGIKVFRFSLNQALDFYGPVKDSLREKLAPIFGLKAKEILEKEFAVSLGEEMGKTLSEGFGRVYAEDQFGQLIEFMSGRRPDTCGKDDADKPGEVKCMILLYEGENAIKKIRDVLGPTDPLKAPSGTVRREFGSSVMINTAHASDSAESSEREQNIVRINENSSVSVIKEYLAKRKR